ncbi:HECT domain [Trinorchestia longiramus]|nr:HECT domain [Trinorchestia longiramus]
MLQMQTTTATTWARTRTLAPPPPPHLQQAAAVASSTSLACVVTTLLDRPKPPLSASTPSGEHLGAWWGPVTPTGAWWGPVTPTGAWWGPLTPTRNVGRLLGLCLLQNELCPISLNRHVLKYILGHNPRFHDLAFFDGALYESLRQLVHLTQVEAGSPKLTALHQDFASMGLFFCIDQVAEEGGGTVELCSDGRHVPVTPTNVCDYVRLYATYRMLHSQSKALQSMREGVLDVIPAVTLEGLTPEDLRLLLNGVGDINVTTLIWYTTFNDESAESNERLNRFKRWLWTIVEKMSTQEKQDLVYFWTGSPALPASEEGFQPLPSVTIRPADDSHLPTANTCISRLYIPLYSSRSILNTKLLLAIKTKNFGFV